MIITVTSIKLRRFRGFFRLSIFGYKIQQQLKQQKGFVKMLMKSGSGNEHFTLTVWESEADMKAFARSGAHLSAMKASRSLSSETRSHTFASETIPDWPEATRLLYEQGKRIAYQKP